ncbi:hypothetical protein E2C01_025915 [Portunus trituberculatus]|uniref:Uncharacterized protein n=1 Tax=Portunus trituberculatus TaxID=210409 RepID=A0A5B7EH03_PORTR|nr:hypothetical protein [Portunus trituberculatus]
MALLHVVIGDKNIDEEGSVELEQTRARLVETQNELDRLKETLCQREEDCEKLRQGGRKAARPAPLWSAVNSSRPGSESPAPASLVTPTCAAAHAQHIRLNPPHSELFR